MGKKNIIEINGTKYDTRTGEVVSTYAATPTRVMHHQPTKPVAPKATMHDVVRQPAKAIKRTPKTSETLMRHAVKKPKPLRRHFSHATGHTDSLVRQADRPLIAAKLSVKSLNPNRLKRASKFSQSDSISHFSDISSNDRPPVRPRATTVPKPAAHQFVQVQPHPTTALLDNALRNATSHTQPPHNPAKSKKRHVIRKIGLVTGAVAFFFVIGFAVFHEIPNMRFKLASARAGFGAVMPNHSINGYELQKLDYSQGVIAANFSNGSEDYVLIQKPTPWNSQALRDSFIEPKYRAYRTIEAGGRSVFLYGQGNASWINGGVWYQINSGGALSDHQLLELATSI